MIITNFQNIDEKQMGDNLTILKKYASLKVPRYTSYPTAPHFNEQIGETTYKKWLSNLDENESLSLYFHVPYCHKMCTFCGCFTKITKRYDPVEEYSNHLLKELHLIADILPQKMKVKHIHWGGGTPTILSPDDFSKIMQAAHERFIITDDAELATEIDPRTIDSNKIRALAKSGINRASLGVQDMSENVQEAIGRIQPYEITENVVNWLREAGINDINLDLMYGLPYQTLDDVINSINLSVQLKPQRFALFGYAHVPWFKTHQKLIKEKTLPDEAMRIEQTEVASDTLASHDYVRIGLDHFAHKDDSMAIALKDGTLHRNFQGYTVDNATTLIGMGASAIGKSPKGYAQNTSQIRQYTQAIAENRFPIARGFEMTKEDIICSDVIERLMCDLYIDLDDIINNYDIPDNYFEKNLKAVAEYAKDGLAKISGNKIIIPDDKRHFVRIISSAFDAYFKENKAKHSLAV